MRKLITILICVIALSAYSYAQFNPYLASEQIVAARDEAAKVLTSPKLVSVATLNGSIPGVPIPLAWDITNGANKGKSTAWVYIFNSQAEPQNYQAIAVGVSMLGVMAFNLTSMGTNLGALGQFASDKSLDDVQWMNSDALVTALTSCEPYTNFKSAYPNGYPKYAVLGYADYPNLEANTPYWAITMWDTSDSLLILINALNGSVVDVNEQSSVADISLYPNPSQDFVIIRNNSSDIFTIKLFDIQGNLLSPNFESTEKQNRVDLGNLVNGKYFIHINYGKENKILPIIISR
ncbi:T9SS C-terminal target domain-containing protein [Bacteroidetes/Chlorobi group bacterium ChocPot_Mid]|jgi:hypothetical protein|nr:MAG: T9SS C-terminal target domain-containing protein [Bacteroidetes/Chlorobi group bacterium ChocPot_Mid]